MLAVNNCCRYLKFYPISKQNSKLILVGLFYAKCMGTTVGMTMKNTIKNIGLAVVLSATLAGCQSMQNQGSSSNNGTLGDGLSIRPERPTELVSARSHFREANYGLAEKNFRKAVELKPTNAEAWLGLAASYDQLGLFKRSDRAYRQAIKLVGPKPAILNNQGYSQLLRGNKKQARKLLRKASRLDPDNARIKGNLELLSKA